MTNATARPGPPSTTTTTVDTIGDVGEYVAVAIGPHSVSVTSYRDVTNGRLRVAKCNSRTCQ